MRWKEAAVGSMKRDESKGGAPEELAGEPDVNKLRRRATGIDG